MDASYKRYLEAVRAAQKARKAEHLDWSSQDEAEREQAELAYLSEEFE